MVTNLKQCVKDEEESLCSSTILTYLDIIKFYWAHTEINNRGGGKGIISTNQIYSMCGVSTRYQILGTLTN